jgi:CBS domain-containing protein
MTVKVKDLLRAKGTEVVTVAPDAPVHHALGLLAAHGIGALVVSADGRHIDGIVSERDVVRRLHIDGPAVVDGPVAAVMSTSVVTCEPTDELAGLMQRMTQHRIRHLPVVVEGELTGIVSIGDVVKARVDELEEERRSLHEYISAR